MLNLILVVLLVLLVIPQPLSKTVKKGWPILGVLAVVVLVVFIISKIEAGKLSSEPVIITALNDKNEKAEGSEVWLTKVIISGKEYEPSDYFGSEWIKRDSTLIWRSYEQKEGMPNEISAYFRAGADVTLVFQSNKWRGLATITYGEKNETIDFYSDTEAHDQTRSYTLTMGMEASANYDINRTDVLVIIFAVLLLLNIVNSILSVKRGQQLFQNDFSQRELWMDALKVMSAVMIVLIHRSGSMYTSSFASNTSLWRKLLWINAIPRFAVPCFLMITGALTLEKTYDYDKALLHRMVRILVPLFVWSSFYVIARELLWHSGDGIVKELFKIPFEHKNGGLWYAYQLIWIYLGLPFWQRLYQSINVRFRWCFVLFALGIPGILTNIGELSLLNVPEYLPFTSTNPIICYVGLLFLGKLLYELVLKTKTHLLMIQGSILLFCGLISMVIFTIYVSNKTGQANSCFFSEVRLPAVLYSSGIFLFLGSMRQIFLKLPVVLQKLVVSLSRISLGVFMSCDLLPWIFPSIQLGKIWISPNSGSIPQLLLCVVIYYGVTAAGCLLASNLPILKRLVL